MQLTFLQVFSNPILRRRIACPLLMSIASVVGFWSTASWVPEQAAQVSAQSNSQLYFSTAYAALILMADRLGHKPTIWLYYLGALIVSLCLFLLVRDQYLLLVLVAASGFSLAVKWHG